VKKEGGTVATSPPKNKDVLNVPGSRDKTPGRITAEVCLSPIVGNAVTARNFTKGSFGSSDLTDTVAVIAEFAAKAQKNDLSEVEATLIAQATTLNAIFTELARKILAVRGDHPGLVHIISAMEACNTYKPWHDKQTRRTLLRPDTGKCLHYYYYYYYYYYFYFIDAELGLIYLRVPTWCPFRLQFYCNGHSCLRATKFCDADLSGAHLEGANFFKAVLDGADLAGALLTGAQFLNCAQLVVTRNWQSAFRDDALACGAAIPDRKRLE
jgi:Pentapeptide repeats (8 copies)